MAQYVVLDSTALLLETAVTAPLEHSQIRQAKNSAQSVQSGRIKTNLDRVVAFSVLRMPQPSALAHNAPNIAYVLRITTTTKLELHARFVRLTHIQNQVGTVCPVPRDMNLKARRKEKVVFAYLVMYGTQWWEIALIIILTHSQLRSQGQWPPLQPRQLLC